MPVEIAKLMFGAPGIREFGGELAIKKSGNYI